jgi:murein DD-endopeptidase MepM/ murein hydrolase activator NlpD
MTKKYWPEIIFISVSFLIIAYFLLSGVLRTGWFSEDVAEDVSIPEMLFGFPVDSFRITAGKIRSGQNLGSILSEYGVTTQKIDQLSRNSEGVFDLRKIRDGQDFYLFQSRDTDCEACYFVYEKNKVEYVVFNLKDSLSISLGKKEIRIEQKSASGVIHSNLWNTITANRLSPMLAIELSRIYAWSIDFFGIQKGDRFRLLYEEQFADTVSIGVGPVYAAEFEHAGKSYKAFRFFQAQRFEYFNENGENLRKEFLKAPLNFSRVSSHFSASRLHPVLKIRRPHFGVDYAAPRGTPVESIGDGTVTEKGFQHGGAGNYLKIRHNSEYSTAYMHLSGFGKGIVRGSRVSQGEVIGFVGSTGLATGPHLDFRVYRNGTPVDPLKLESPPAEPVKMELMKGYQISVDSLKSLLNSVPWPLE